MALIENNICTRIETSIELLREVDPDIQNFSCGNAVIDQYLKGKATQDVDSVTYIFRDKDSKEIIAFASISCSGIIFRDNMRLEILPAVQIRYFATNEKFQHIPMESDLDSRFCISDEIFCRLVCLIRDVAEKSVGARYIVLYAVPSAVNFYRRNCFEEFTEMFTPEHYRYIDGCTPMYQEM